MHQHPLARPQSGQHREPVVGGQEHHRHAGGLSHRPPPRHPRDQPPIDGRLRTRQPEDPHHRVADGHIGDAGTDFGHDAGALGTQLRGTGIHAQRHQHVPEIHPGRGHRHPHLSGFQPRRRVRLDRQVLQRPGVAGGQPPHRRRFGQRQQRPLAGRLQPDTVGDPVTHHQLRFAAADHRRDVQRAVGVDQYDAARMLGLRRAHQPPDGRAGQVGDVVSGQGHRTTGLHHQRPGRVAGQPGLQDAEGLVRRGVDRGDRSAGGRLPHGHALANPVARERDRRPHHVEELAAPGVGRQRRRQLVGRHGARHQLPHREHRQARRVGQIDRHGAGARRCQPHPDPRRTGGVQAHALPGERQHGLDPLVGHPERVQRRVQQHRVDAEAAGRDTGVLREFDLGERFGPPPPYGTQPLKGRAVPVAAVRQAVVRAGHVHRLGAGGGPHRQIRHRGGRAVAQQAFGVQNPIRLRRTRIHGDGPRSGAVGRLHHHLQLHDPARRDRQRCRQRQFLDHRAADLVTRPQRQLHEARPGEQHRAGHGVVAQPRLGGRRQPAGQHHTAGIRPVHHRPQQRVLGLGQTQAGDVRRSHRIARQPKPAPHTGIRRQRDAPRAQPGERRRPVQVRTCREQLSGRRQQRVDLGAALGHRHHRDRAVGREALVDRCRQRRPGADL